tara:strand:- start:3714 stop:3881 length:168 start_codon:yes stop_codon:yes gene_type:complete
MDKKNNKEKICKLCGISVEKHFSKFGIFGIYPGCHFSSKKNKDTKGNLSDCETII